MPEACGYCNGRTGEGNEKGRQGDKGTGRWGVAASPTAPRVLVSLSFPAPRGTRTPQGQENSDAPHIARQTKTSRDLAPTLKTPNSTSNFRALPHARPHPAIHRLPPAAISRGP